MAAKVDCGDEKVSEKKRSRIKALEQRLSAAALGKSPAALSAQLVSHSQEKEKHKKKRDTGKRKHSDPVSASGIFAQASGMSSGPSKFKGKHYIIINFTIQVVICFCVLLFNIFFITSSIILKCPIRFTM
jgi:hypothetical protein